MHHTASSGSDIQVDGPGLLFIVVAGLIFAGYSIAAALERKRDLDELSGKNKEKN